MQRIAGIVVMVALLLGCGPSTPPAAATSDGFAHHPDPTNPVYLEATRYEAVKSRLPPPPAKGSAEQARDEAELLQRQRDRTPADCGAAASEVHVSLKSFFGAPQGPLDDATVARLGPFFEQMRNDADYFVQKLKTLYPRPRPFTYVDGLSPCVPKERTDAYPSGHSVIARLFARVLTELFPGRQSEFEARARAIAAHRVASGMHHPTDVDAGRELGDILYTELHTSQRWTEDLQRLRSP